MSGNKISLIGKTVAEVKSIGIPIRIIKVDGEFLPGWRNFKDGKRDVHVKGGRIVYELHKTSRWPYFLVNSLLDGSHY